MHLTSAPVGLDVHRDSISVAVLDSQGKVVKQTVIETKSAAVLELVQELRGTLHVVLEEGTWSTWLYELLQGRVARVVVCDARKITRTGNKSDRLDARELADLLRCNRVSPVFHQDTGLWRLRELARTYVVLTKEQTRTMNRIKALYRGWAIPCSGQSCYGPKQRQAWLEKLPYAAVRERAKIYYQQLESGQELRRKVRQQLLVQARKHPAYSKLVNLPQIGPVRAALLICVYSSAGAFPQQATILGLLWICPRNAEFGGLPLGGRQTAALQEGSPGAGSEPQPSSGIERDFQKCRHAALQRRRTLSPVSSGTAGAGDPSRNGSPHSSTQTGCHHAGGVEERRKFRRPTTKYTSSLSAGAGLSA
jgi:hypothetical protein